MRVQYIRWKDHITIEQIRDVERQLREAGCRKLWTNYKIFMDDTWNTRVWWN